MISRKYVADIELRRDEVESFDRYPFSLAAVTDTKQLKVLFTGHGPGHWDKLMACNSKIKKFGDKYYLYDISNRSCPTLIRTLVAGLATALTAITVSAQGISPGPTNPQFANDGEINNAEFWEGNGRDARHQMDFGKPVEIASINVLPLHKDKPADRFVVETSMDAKD